MTKPSTPIFEPGRAYRTRDLAVWSSNPPRLAKRLVREGRLVPLAHGLFVHPEPSRFGQAPPSDQELMRVFLDGSPFVFTGPERWNALGLGTTAVFASPLVYNTKRSGFFKLGRRGFLLRRVAFPPDAPLEWFAIDLFEHADQAGASSRELVAALGRALRRKVFNLRILREMMERYASKKTRALIEPAIMAEAA